MDTAHAIESTLQTIYTRGIILCIRLGPGAPVIDAARAAASGGLTVIEMTLTTPGALEAIRKLAGDDRLLVGAGTVMTASDVIRVADAGARFALSPVFDEEVLHEAERRGVLFIPGAATPTEIVAAYRKGARAVKVFPAAALGGPDFIRAVRGPLPQVPIIPTSGPSAETMAEYLAAGASAVGVGNEVFHPGFTLESATAAARRVRAAFDACSTGRSAG
jgi:2-dehydro-3-deoxyphosphogluconate aldolase/(4S)-4-hydroxy-2-oxoglutarate aldolase